MDINEMIGEAVKIGHYGNDITDQMIVTHMT